MTESNKYLSHVDGIRAIAVLAIVAFHISPEIFVGGYLGVDIFFVISGFSITKQITSQIQTGGFSFSEFYVRRIFRLFPALVVTLIATFIAGYFLLTPDHLERVSGAILYSTFSLSNFYFWSESGYFDTASKLKPLLHTWSLSVEEQFYLVWPMLLYITMRFLNKKSLLLVLSVLAMASASAYAIFAESHASTAFFLMPFRLFEFAIGGLLVWVVDAKIKNAIASWFTILSLGGLAYFLYLDPYAASVPLLNAVVPCFLTGILICSGEGGIGRFVLSSRIARLIGKLSYSIYLVHWPIIVFFNLENPVDQSVFRICIVLLLIFACAVLLYWAIESPFREQGKAKEQWRKFKTLALLPVSASLLIVAATAWANNGWPWRYSDRVDLAHIQELMDLNRFRDEIIEYDLVTIRSSSYFNKNGAKRIFVIGDSHARDLAVILNANLDDKKYEIRRMFLDDPCLVVLQGKKPVRGDEKACKQQIEALENSLLLSAADVIIFSSLWWPDTLAGIEQAVDLARTKNPNAVIAVAGRTEVFDDLPESLMSHLVEGGLLSESKVLAFSLRQDKTDIVNQKLFELSKANDFVFLNRSMGICENSQCVVFDNDNNLLFWDGHHFTMAAVRFFGPTIVGGLFESIE